MDPQTAELIHRLHTVAHALIVAPFVAYALIPMIIGVLYVAISSDRKR